MPAFVLFLWSYLSLSGCFLTESEPGAGPCFPYRPAGPFPVCATPRLRLDERACPYTRPGPSPFTRRYISTAMGPVSGSCLSVTVPFTHSSHRPHLLVQSPHSTTLHCAAAAALFQVVPAERSSFQNQVLSAGVGAKPQYPPFHDQLPNFSKTPFP